MYPVQNADGGSVLQTARNYLIDATTEIQAGAVGFAQNQAVVIALIPAFQVHPALRVAAGFNHAHHVTVVMNAFFQIQ